MKIYIVTPVFNDWSSFKNLIENIDQSLGRSGFSVSIIAVDDGSFEQIAIKKTTPSAYICIERIEILHLSKNMGHQRAIAIGLSYVKSLDSSDITIVMDADGEDRPEDLSALIAEQRGSQKIVFARRGKRQEGKIFLLFYHIYKILFWFLTGKRIAFGNYCSIPKCLLGRVTLLPELWNHFAVGIMRSGLPQTTLLLPRGNRYHGKTKMNFVSLVMHGLSAISIYADILAIRMILFTVGTILATCIGGLILLYIKYLTALAIPGWATNVAIGLCMIFFQSFILLMLSAIIVLNSRSGYFAVPIKIYEDFLLEVDIFYVRN